MNVNFLKKYLKDAKVFCICLVIILLNNILFTYIFQNKQELITNPYFKRSFLYLFTCVVLVGPFLETYIFQYLPINWLINKLGVEKKLFIIMLSGLLFSILHAYSWAYQLAMLVPSIIMCYYYFELKLKYGSANAYFFTSLLHVIMNLVPVLNEFYKSML
jgi:hypothetical protein